MDSQIRNKSTVEVEGLKQGIEIELKGNLEIAGNHHEVRRERIGSRRFY